MTHPLREIKRTNVTCLMNENKKIKYPRAAVSFMCLFINFFFFQEDFAQRSQTFTAVANITAHCIKCDTGATYLITIKPQYRERKLNEYIFPVNLRQNTTIRVYSRIS